jgi:hypothetical protein
VHADRGAERADGRLGEWDGHEGTERVVGVDGRQPILGDLLTSMSKS